MFRIFWRWQIYHICINFLSQKVDANMIFTDYWKVIVLIFSGMGNTAFLSQRFDGKMVFTDYRKGLVLDFSVMGSTVFLSQEVDRKIIFTGYWDVLVLNFLVMGNTVFSSTKKLMVRWYWRGLFGLSMIFQDFGNMVFCAS